MPEISDDPDSADRVTANADALKNAWAATLDDMEALAAEYADEGWETITVPAGHTAPEPPDSGVEGRFGLVYVIPGDRAEDVATAIEAGEFPRYDVYRNEAGGQVFLVTVLTDPDTETAVFVAGGFERRTSRSLLSAVQDAGVMYTHLQKLDGTPVGSFEHDDPGKFFPATDFTAGE
ncbi:DUF7529 family protein [Halococcus salsus]|uniref:DUF7529 family protein n=1 Tax=Halococcus salsus TaxID=2162894 RepID=UPI001359E724|nr:hypothetical protein [Halococcus salsus]